MNYKILDKEQEKQRRIDILKSIADFCQKNDIIYYLAYGTMLGAVRENGMIAWDYDIDVMLPRPDYERFVSLYEDDRYRVQYYSINKNYGGKLAIVEDLGTINITDEKMDDNDPLKRISVELYPIDGAFGNRLLFSIHAILIDFLGKCNTIKSISVDNRRKWYKNLFLSILKLLLLPINNNFLVKCIHALSSSKKYEESRFSVISCIGFNSRRTKHKKNVYEVQTMAVFEGDSYPILKEYDLWLTAVYGNYMTPPPEQDINRSKKLQTYYQYGELI